MPSTIRARPTGTPTAAARRTPTAAASPAMAMATRAVSSPEAIGLPGFPASRGASWRSFTAPIENWSRTIDPAATMAGPGVEPATTAAAATTRPSRSEGNGWTSLATGGRRGPPSRRSVDPAGPSDVDELGEIRDEIFDQTVTAVADLGTDARNERPEGDRRHDQVTAGVTADRRRRTTTGSEHAFEFTLVELCCAPEVLDDADDTAADRDVPHQLRCPRVDLLVWLVTKPAAVLGGICREAGGCHKTSCRCRPSMPETSFRSDGRRRRDQLPCAGSPSGGRSGREPSGQSLKTSVSHRPTGPGGGRSSKSA